MKTVNIEKMDSGSRYEVASFSYIGGRQEQQDCACAVVKEDELLAAVCDGMGGMSGGRIASRTVIEYLKNQYQGKTDETFLEFFKRMLEEADEQVFFLKDDYRRKLNAGTTLVAAGIQGDELYWLSVGDSRLYIKRGHEMAQLTRDHNYFLQLNDWYSSGKITKEQYDGEKAKGEALISYVGMGGIEVFDLGSTPFKLKVGDVLLLATDGLWRFINGAQILEILDTDESLKEKAERLYEFTKQIPNKEEQDNTTFVLIKISCMEEENHEKSDM